MKIACDISLPKVKNSIFLQHYQEINANKHCHNPTGALLEVTYRCNLNCQYCYLKDAKNISCQKDELTTKEIYFILDSLAEAGCLLLSISGGEPLFRDDFEDIYLYAREKAFLLGFVTNATLITPKIADCFKRNPPASIKISLNAITEETYNRISGVKGYFKQCMQGIQCLQERKIPFNVGTVVTNINFNEISAIQKYVKKLNAPWHLELIPQQGINGSRDPCELRIPPEKVVELEQELFRGIKGPVVLKSQEHPFSPYSHRLISLVINPYGEVRPCVFSCTPTYNLRHTSLKQIWRNFSSHAKLRNPENNTKCEFCKYKIFCSPCIMCKKKEMDIQENSNSYFCSVASLRYKKANKSGLNYR